MARKVKATVKATVTAATGGRPVKTAKDYRAEIAALGRQLDYAKSTVDYLTTQCGELRGERDRALAIEAHLRMENRELTEFVDVQHKRVKAAVTEIDRLRDLVQEMSRHMSIKPFEWDTTPPMQVSRGQLEAFRAAQHHAQSLAPAGEPLNYQGTAKGEFAWGTHSENLRRDVTADAVERKPTTLRINLDGGKFSRG